MAPRLTQLCAFGGAVLSAATLIGCGGGGGGGGDYSTPTPTPTVQMGTLGVSMTDAPACGFDAVNVTVSKVRVHQSATAADTDSGWTDITLAPARKINLLSLTNGALEALGQTPLTPGHYSQLRLVLDPNTGNALANSVLPTGTTVEQSLDTPSAVQSGIKLVNEFDVVANQRVDLVLDFDACKSVITKGNGKYALKPVVKVIPTAVNGISGFVSTALAGSHVMVSAQQNGNIIAATAPSSTGEFYLARLAPGSYDVVLTADNRATSVVSGINVATSTSTVALSTVAAPLNMAAASAPGNISGTVTMTPASTEAAFVAAKQSFAAGPTVTVRYQGADLANGSYMLAKLPTAAPQLAQYNGVLPLVFLPQPLSLPGTAKYRVDASATGYTTKTVAAVDISLADQLNVNFALTP